MQQWHKLMHDIILGGSNRPDRTGVGTCGIFGANFAINMATTFPAVTTKRLPFKAVAGEMATFISGSHCLPAFHKNGCHFWDTNGNDTRWQDKAGCKYLGDLGRIYGVQWRFWRGLDVNGEPIVVDQLDELINGMREDPFGRRHIVTAWNPAELDQMCLPPCPLMFQCYIALDNDGNKAFVDMLVTQRSCDVFLGLPCDIAGYALLNALIAKELGLKARVLRFSIGDAHIYRNHLEEAVAVLERAAYPRPKLVLSPVASLFGFEPSMVSLADYVSHPAVTVPLNN